jgi:hypothetical protein
MTDSADIRTDDFPTNPHQGKWMAQADVATAGNLHGLASSEAPAA